ncbi:hypothetical protein [Bacillus cereus group sp. BfR-BA-01328]|uniref:hypothetical protein n=1 Tax=Bacillus cereus group sp. BfR-BA-01328 TaxID=2920304 RepID=UPI001F5A002B
MKVEIKKFELIEMYVEDKEYDVVNKEINKYRKQGFSATNPTTQYRHHGNEEDKTYWSKLTKKVEII